MIKLVLSLALLLLFVGCERESNGNENAKAAEKQDHSPGTVRLTVDAQKLSGIRIAEAQLRRMPETLAASGQIVMNEERTAHIGSYLAARVIAVFAAPGDVVKQGAVLARMHSHEVHETLAAFRTAREEVQRQRNALEFGGRNRDRFHRLYALKSASLQEVERAETEYRGMQANVANAETAVHREVAHLSDILHVPENALDHIDEAMEKVPIVSPIAGIVIARMVTAGTVMEPGQEAFTVSDLSSLWMLAAVNEPDIAKVRIGAHANVMTQAFPEQQFSATVTRINGELDAKTRTLPVRLLLKNPGGRLRSGMYANAQIQQGSTRAAVVIPEEAIQEVNGGAIAFVKKADEEFEMRPIQIARRLNGEAEISSGLKGGDLVIVKGSFIAKSEMLKSQIGE